MRNQPLSRCPGELHLELHGGIFEGKNQSALLRFLCDHYVDEVRHSNPYP